MSLECLKIWDGSRHDGHVLVWQAREAHREMRKAWYRPVRGAWFTDRRY